MDFFLDLIMGALEGDGGEEEGDDIPEGV